MNRNRYQAAVLMGLLVIAAGCDNSRPVLQQPAPTTTQPDKAAAIEAFTQAAREAEKHEPAAPVIELTTPTGWSKSKLRPLPAEDHGFSVAYEHESGLAVTLYQFTRGRASISDDLNSAPVQEEFRNAKNGIEQAVQLGYWQAAKEKATDTVVLGDSQQQALWSQHELTVDGATAVSDTYVWARNNAFFKLRCTNRSDDLASNQATLRPLLTALGSATTSANR